VTFADVPEAITQGDSLGECLEQAADCLEEAIAARIEDGMDLPEPSEAAVRQHLADLPLQTALKAALYVSAREAGVSETELGRRLDVDEREARRILDPRYGTKLPTLERALPCPGEAAGASGGVKGQVKSPWAPRREDFFRVHATQASRREITQVGGLPHEEFLADESEPWSAFASLEQRLCPYVPAGTLANGKGSRSGSTAGCKT
jgi:antitoxin HicB